MNTPWKRFSLLYALQFMQLFDYIAISPAGALLAKEKLIHFETISASLAVYSLAAIVSSLCLSKWETARNNFGMGKLLCLFALSPLILLISVNDTTFIASRAIGGLTGGIIGAISYSQISRIEPGGNQGIWNGRIQTVQSLVSLAGIPLALMMIAKIGAWSFFLFMLLYALAMVVFVSKSDFIEISHKPSQITPKKKHSGRFEVFFTGFMCYLASFLFLTNMPAWLLIARNISSDELSLAYIIGGGLILFLSSYLGGFSNRFGAPVLLSISVLAIVLSQLPFAEGINAQAILYLAVPIYFLISTARAIYQRAIVLAIDGTSIHLHMLNNIAVRLGIFTSGLILWLIGLFKDKVSEVFFWANTISIGASLVLIAGLALLERHRKIVVLKDES